MKASRENTLAHAQHPRYLWLGNAAPVRSVRISPISAWLATAFAATSLVWYCTFTLFAPYSIPLGPYGSLAVPDVFALGMLIALAVAGLPDPDLLDMFAIAAGGWMLLAGLVNVLGGETIDLTYFIRYTARLAPYWFALPMLRRLPATHRRWLFATGAITAACAALGHLYIILTHNVPLLMKLYYQWSGPEASEKLRYLLALTPNAFLNGSVPDAMPLILSVYAACVAALVYRKAVPFLAVWAGLAALCGAAALVTLERSYALLIAGVIPLFTAWRYRLRGGSTRALAIPAALFIAFLGFSALTNRDLVALYQERFQRLSDDASFDMSRNARVQDTVHGFLDSLDAPLFGTGLTRPQEYVSETGGDTHGLVSLALVGGYPLLILSMLSVAQAMRLGLRRRTWGATAGVLILVQILFLMLINTAPGFVWIRSLAPAVIAMTMASSLHEKRGELLVMLHTAERLPETASA